VPPTKEGLLDEIDVRELVRFSERLDVMFMFDAAAGRPVVWRRTGERTATAEIELAESASIGVIRIQENIARGQAIAKHVVTASDSGEWREVGRGSTVGYTRLHRIEPTAIRAFG
jgi:alpha-L-fucosidase